MDRRAGDVINDNGNGGLITLAGIGMNLKHETFISLKIVRF